MNNITVAISLAYHDRSITVLDNGKLVDIILEDRISRNQNAAARALSNFFRDAI